MSIFRENLLLHKTAFITGGSSGIGLRMAERFAEHGAKVALLGRKAEKLESAAESIRSRRGIVSIHAADVRDYAAVEGALQSTRDRFGEIDILICGAAGNFPAPVTGISANGFKAVIDIDLLGTFNACRAAYRASAQAGRDHSGHFRLIRFPAHRFSVSCGRRKAGIDIS